MSIVTSARKMKILGMVALGCLQVKSKTLEEKSVEELI